MIRLVWLTCLMVVSVLPIHALEVADFTFSHIGKAEGLDNQRIFAIRQMPSGAIWWSSMTGVSFSTRRDQSRGIRLALNNLYPTLARRLSPLFLASAIILILFGAILLRLLRYLDEQKMMADLRNDFSYATVQEPGTHDDT